MKRYLCPVCDQELKGRYCPTCRKIVRQPIVYEGVLPNEDSGGYLLNHEDIHPGSPCVEANQTRSCQTAAEKAVNARFSQSSLNSSRSGYRSGRSGAASSGSGYRSGQTGTASSGYRAGQSTAPGSQIWRTGQSGSSSYSSASGGARGKTKSGKKSFFVFIAVIFGIALVIQVIAAVYAGYVTEKRPEGEPVSAGTAGQPETEPLPETTEEDYEESYAEPETVDYDEILSIGLPCNGYWHYPVQGERVYRQLEEYAVSKLDLVMTDKTDYVENTVEHDGNVNYTLYQHYWYWDWDRGYFGVVSDSVTEGIHYICAYGWDAEPVIELCMEALAMVEDEDSASVVRPQLYDALEKDGITDGYYFDMGVSSVWICKDAEDGYFTVHVYPVTE